MRRLLFLLVIAFAGCAAQAAGTPPRLDMASLVHAHPLYGSLAQYDRQIAALRATLRVSGLAGRTQAIEHARGAVRSQLRAAAADSQDIAAAAPVTAGGLQAARPANAPSESAVRSGIQRAYAAQAAQLRAAAQNGMARYRSTLQDRDRRALAAYVSGMNASVRRAYDARSRQLYEKESTLALDLAKADSGARLQLRAKLQTLALGADARRRIQAQLGAIQAREDRAVAALRRRDQAVLAAYLPGIRAQAGAEIARMRASMQARTAANLRARERVLAAQNAAATRLRFGAAPSPAPSPANMQSALQHVLRARPADVQAFTTASADLRSQFASLRASDDAETASAKAQIAALQRDRTQLYDLIVSQIMRLAQRAEREHPGTDVTRAVRADLTALAR